MGRSYSMIYFACLRAYARGLWLALRDTPCITCVSVGHLWRTLPTRSQCYKRAGIDFVYDLVRELLIVSTVVLFRYAIDALSQMLYCNRIASVQSFKTAPVDCTHNEAERIALDDYVSVSSWRKIGPFVSVGADNHINANLV